MEEKEMTISRLCELTETKPRSIHFYRKEGLLQGELKGAGRGARYTQEHLVKLKLIRKLQKSHMKLSGIKKAMDAMTFEEMEDFVYENKDQQKKVYSVDELDEFLPNAPVEFELSSMTNRIEAPEEASPNEISFLDLREDNDTRPRHSKTTGRGHILGKVTRTTSLQRESWQRISIAEGVELNIRQDVLHGRRREIDQVLREIRAKLDR
jgi:DNA-binding transcriptional MerR regulator